MNKSDHNSIESFLCSSEVGVSLLDELIQANVDVRSITLNEVKEMLVDRVRHETGRVRFV